ncbi:MAG: methionine ABC transporter ATP-binding protein, partial [Bifidobacterium mongoliense]
MADEIITLDHVVREFRRKGGETAHEGVVRAVDDVSLSVRAGDIYGIIGS